MKIWKLALDRFPEIPRATEHGWTIIDDHIEPLWNEKDVLPKNLIDLMMDLDSSESEEELEDETSESDDSDSDSIN